MSDFAKNRFPALAPQEPLRARSRSVPLQSLPVSEMCLLCLVGLALILGT